MTLEPWVGPGLAAPAAGWAVTIRDAAGGLLGTPQLEDLPVTAPLDAGVPTPVDRVGQVESAGG